MARRTDRPVFVDDISVWGANSINREWRFKNTDVDCKKGKKSGNLEIRISVITGTRPIITFQNYLCARTFIQSQHWKKLGFQLKYKLIGLDDWRPVGYVTEPDVAKPKKLDPEDETDFEGWSYFTAQTKFDQDWDHMWGRMIFGWHGGKSTGRIIVRSIRPYGSGYGHQS